MLYSIRPNTLGDFIGQEPIKKRLKIIIQSAKIRNEPLDHILLTGPPGLGKTTLANIIANEFRVKFHSISAPAITKTGDLAKILSLLNFKDVLFIDEIHRLSRPCEELLYSAMEDYFIDVIVGEGITAKQIRIPLQKFTLIGATTRAGFLSAPLRSRFGMELKFSFYTQDEIANIIQNIANEVHINLSLDLAHYIAEFCRMTPREAIRIVKRLRDYIIVKGKDSINKDFIQDCLKELGIYEMGINETDKKILSLMFTRFNGGPVGIKTLASLLDEEERTIMENHEPFLLKIGFIEKTKKGRILTKKAIEFLRKNEYVLENLYK